MDKIDKDVEHYLLLAKMKVCGKPEMEALGRGAADLSAVFTDWINNEMKRETSVKGVAIASTCLLSMLFLISAQAIAKEGKVREVAVMSSERSTELLKGFTKYR